MFEVGDKVRYVPNSRSPRNASTDMKYIAHEGHVGVIRWLDSHLTYGYSVEFPDGWSSRFTAKELRSA